MTKKANAYVKPIWSKHILLLFIISVIIIITIIIIIIMIIIIIINKCKPVNNTIIVERDVVMTVNKPPIHTHWDTHTHTHTHTHTLPSVVFEFAV